MKIHNLNSIIDLPKFSNPYIKTLSIGSFSMLHLGHWRIINELKKDSHHNALLVLINKSKNKPAPQVSELSYFFALNNVVKELFLIHMPQSDFQIRAEGFLNILKKSFVNLKSIVHGENWKFGFKREGNAKTIKNFNLASIIISTYTYKNQVKLSSSEIWNYLTSKETFNLAINLMKTKPSIIDKVQEGQKSGHKLGFPTINVDYMLGIPKIDVGIYFTKIYLFSSKRLLDAVTNIGYAPTISSANKMIKHETHILNFKENIYHQKVEIFYYYRYEEERKHNSILELQAFIQKIIEARKEYGKYYK